MRNYDKDDVLEIEKCKKEYAEKGEFSSQLVNITDVLPEAEHLGGVVHILGYEPQNYKLEGVYRYNGRIHTSAYIGNELIVYGITDPKFAKEIEEALKKNIK